MLNLTLNGQLFNYKQYSVENGFPQSTVNHIFQDDKGFLWFATQNGAVKFDGFTYKIFDKENGLTGNVIHHINQDHYGNMWISSKSGLTKIIGDSVIRYTKDNGLYSDIVYNTTITPDKKILICTKHGVNIIVNDKLIKMANAFIPKQFLVRRNKQILALSEDNIYILKYNSFKPLAIDLSELKPPFNYITEGPDSSLWIASKKGIYKLYKKSVNSYNEKDGLQNNDINKLLIDHENNLWYSSEISGCGKLYNNRFHNFTADLGMVNTSILALFEDNERNIWIGGRNGVTMVNTKVPFIHYDQISSYKNEIIMGMTIDDENKIWFCTYGFGLVKYDGNKYINYNKENGSIDNHFFDIEIDNKGIIWLASANNGIIRYDGKTFKKVSFQNNIRIKRRVLTIFKDSKENLWFGTNGNGVFKYNGVKFEQFGKGLGFSASNIMSINEDLDNNIWFGTIGEGLFKYDGEKIIDVEKEEKIDAGIVRCIEIVNGSLWFGTASNGIFTIKKLADKTNQIYINEEAGLNSNNIYLLHNDSKGNLWCGSEKGVDKLRFDENNNLFSLKNYTINEGFLGVETNINASLEDQNGDMWFGTINGAVRYNENADKKNTTENKTYITNIRLFFEEFDWKAFSDKHIDSNLPANLVLPHDLNHLSFDFIGLCYSNPQKVKYKYRLIGQNDKWSPATTDKKAIFTNIAPGTYEFQVISANNDDLWNKNPISFQFTIKPPYWQEIWFYTLLLLALTFLIYFIAEYRNKSLKKAKINLERKVTERTKQINKQKEKLQLSNRKIKDSINYAERIQSAMLPAIEIFKDNFLEYFILYSAKDIISGDFYWAREVYKTIFLANKEV